MMSFPGSFIAARFAHKAGWLEYVCSEIVGPFDDWKTIINRNDTFVNDSPIRL